MIVAWRSACSAGSATLTTVPSMNVRLDPRIVATSVHRRVAVESATAVKFTQTSSGVRLAVTSRRLRQRGRSRRTRSLHLSKGIAMYAGDSRGRWEGRTLVAETTNLNGRSNLSGNAGEQPTARTKVIERYTLTV